MPCTRVKLLTGARKGLVGFVAASAMRAQGTCVHASRQPLALRNALLHTTKYNVQTGVLPCFCRQRV